MLFLFLSPPHVVHCILGAGAQAQAAEFRIPCTATSCPSFCCTRRLILAQLPSPQPLYEAGGVTPRRVLLLNDHCIVLFFPRFFSSSLFLLPMSFMVLWALAPRQSRSSLCPILVTANSLPLFSAVPVQ
mmetsp:Transcript_26117/g.44929  ORF Transcript_26117/g.44929 Transcript_26117/m.44929 type:complete len:129 (+) Transcript_26117:1021-1407(+)